MTTATSFGGDARDVRSHQPPVARTPGAEVAMLYLSSSVEGNPKALRSNWRDYDTSRCSHESSLPQPERGPAGI